MLIKFRNSMLCLLLAAPALVSLIDGPATLNAQNQPEIKITEVPPAAQGGPDEMFPISGEVKGVPGSDYRVVIYVFAGGKWFVQPFDYAPSTEIKANGKFENETHGGSIYAALLVRSQYKAKATLVALPDVGGDVVARFRVSGKKE